MPPGGGRLAVRLSMAATGVAMLVIYLLAGYGVYRLATLVWARRPDPLTTALVVIGVAVTVGYASYRIGTARIRRAIGGADLPRERVPALYDRLDDLTRRMDVRSPGVHLARLDAPNALALGGPRSGVLVLDASLFDLLEPAELLAIVAHELAHLESRDSLVKALGYSLVSTVAGLFGLAVLPVAVVAGGIARAVAYLRGDHPIDVRRTTVRAHRGVASLAVVLLVVLTLGLHAYSRRREYAADDRAVAVTGDPLALARALEKIERASTPRGLLASLYIHGDETGLLTRLLATHPEMDERIERLRRRDS